ncbi:MULTISPECIES: CopG family transcriptional regulator [unclassified Actinomyces]|uniref:ribbon-helix-helix domain-containing protein n=1 Tax=unclassified Actinomyces TaxID=2609248 RepID=UPI00201771B0|nr:MULTISPECIES: CopG family transcriptional regulator [unclassified Actinomyces]MCL3778617.1 CopG family transcriptional regulator [Actinomyces sp. AC-20-1]MCL3789939.1 CopG family transcriptional regulator [Actinomyces sp. 187325]MCL3792155.1 CopG family transcriptional regulator [Actinomyces sp. 186855]MCL3794887.1 CopG family transcriptional regulator [Actinomyces sp. 217892]
MNLEVVEFVPGIGEPELAAFQTEAEAGHGTVTGPSYPNPHWLRAVPDDLVDAVERMARARGVSPEAVIRAALTDYLATA